MAVVKIAIQALGNEAQLRVGGSREQEWMDFSGGESKGLISFIREAEMASVPFCSIIVNANEKADDILLSRIIES